MKIVLFANTDWYLYNFRRNLARRLMEQGGNVILLSPDGPYSRRLIEEGFNWVPAPLQRASLNPFRELQFLRWLVQFLRTEQVALIHSFTIKCAVYGGLAGRLADVSGRISAIAGLGYVYSSSDLLARFLRPFVGGMLRIALGGLSSRLILQNHDDAKWFAQNSIVNPVHIRTILGSGVDCRRFVPGPDRSEENPVTVLLPARLLWDKGIREYIEAAKILKMKGVGVRLIVAGDVDEGNPAAVPRAVVDTWSSDGLVEWLGHVEDMVPLYQSVDIVALPSYREGLPKSLIEAAACALPLVASDVPGCRDVVCHQSNGILVKPRDAVQLADAIHLLVLNPMLRAKYGAAAREKALTLFNEEVVLKETLSVYAEILPKCLDENKLVSRALNQANHEK